jgi:hypothetical protein
LNNLVIGLGILLLIFAVPLALYPDNSMTTTNGQTLLKTTYPYLTEAEIVAVLGIIVLAAGVVLKSPKKKVNLEETG